MAAKNIYGLLVFVLLSANVSAQKTLKNDYYMVSNDDTKMLRESNDTLYEYHCSAEFIPFFSLKPNHYKILSSKKESSYTLLKLESLDSISLTTVPYPLTRYSVLILRNISDTTIEMLNLFRGLTKKEVDDLIISDFSNKFFSTLISDSYKKELGKLKSVNTKQDLDIIITTLKSDKYKALIDKYQASNINDMYGAILSSELLYHACIDNKFNPIYASKKIDALLKEK